MFFHVRCHAAPTTVRTRLCPRGGPRHCTGSDGRLDDRQAHGAVSHVQHTARATRRAYFRCGCRPTPQQRGYAKICVTVVLALQQEQRSLARVGMSAIISHLKLLLNNFMPCPTIHVSAWFLIRNLQFSLSARYSKPLRDSWRYP
jgi:hypothetical protein